MTNFQTENNQNTSQAQNFNLYENLLVLKDKNNVLQMKLQEMMIVKSELDDKIRRLNELENVNSILKDENK